MNLGEEISKMVCLISEHKTSKPASPGVRSLDIQDIVEGEFRRKDKNTEEDKKELEAHDV